MKISLFSSVRDTAPASEMDFDDYLDKIQSGFWMRDVSDVRRGIKAKTDIPCVTASGTFAKREIAGLNTHSGFIALDFDDKENPEFPLDSVAADEYVYAIHRSVSGNGFVAYVRINPPQHRDAYDALERYFANTHGAITDKSCKDVSRLRIVSYDEKIIINRRAKKWTDVLPRTHRVPRGAYGGHRSNLDDLQHVVDQLVAGNICLTETYNDWLRIGMGLAHTYGESARDTFHQISAIDGRYDAAQCDAKYDNWLRTNRGGVTASTFFWYAQRAGVSILSPRTQTIRDVAKRAMGGVGTSGGAPDADTAIENAVATLQTLGIDGDDVADAVRFFAENDTTGGVLVAGNDRAGVYETPNGYYYRTTGERETNKRITNFLFDIPYRFSPVDGRTVVAVRCASATRESTHMMDGGLLAKVSDATKWFDNHGYVIFHSRLAQTALDLLRHEFYKTCRHIQRIPYLGHVRGVGYFFANAVFVYQTGDIIERDENGVFDIPNIGYFGYVDDENAHQLWLHEQHADFDLHDYLHDMQGWMPPHVAETVCAQFVVTAFADIIREYIDNVPLFVATGETASGKSQLMLACMRPFFASKDAPRFPFGHSTSVGISRVMAHAMNAPVFLEEATDDATTDKNAGQKIERLKAIYDGMSRVKGKRTTGNEFASEQINGVLLFAGQTLPTEKSFRNRCLIIRTDKSHHTAATYAAMRQFQARTTYVGALVDILAKRELFVEYMANGFDKYVDASPLADQRLKITFAVYSIALRFIHDHVGGFDLLQTTNFISEQLENEYNDERLPSELRPFVEWVKLMLYENYKRETFATQGQHEIVGKYMGTSEKSPRHFFPATMVEYDETTHRTTVWCPSSHVNEYYRMYMNRKPGEMDMNMVYHLAERYNFIDAQCRPPNGSGFTVKRFEHYVRLRAVAFNLAEFEREFGETLVDWVDRQKPHLQDSNE